MQDLKPAILMVMLFTLICGGIYPAVVTGIAQSFFSKQANGSLITDQNGRTIGSSLIGQPFSNLRYFWPRPSATADFGYNPLASGGSNSGPTNPAFVKTVQERVQSLHDSGMPGSIPADLVLGSASGLDPHITPAAALAQIPRIARARGLGEEALTKIVNSHIEGRQLGVLGQPRVNVLALNLALDRLAL